MKTLIYGGGAVGLGVASCLIRAGHDVTILGRAASVSLLNSQGLVRSGIFGSETAKAGSFAAITCLDESKNGPFDVVLITVKSFNSENAALDLQNHAGLFNAATILALFQNGWGNAEVFARYFDKQRIYNARVITGFIRPEPNHVDITVHAEAIHIGSLFSSDLQAVGSLCEAIAEGGIPCEPTESIARDLWAKMLFNCPLNSVGAACGVPYGALGQSPWARSTMERIIREIFQVMEAEGHDTFWPSPEAFIDHFYTNLLPSTADHLSSTLQDLRAGKRTEIDALNGAMVTLGEQHGIDVPVSRTLFNLIKFLESHKAASRNG